MRVPTCVLLFGLVGGIALSCRGDRAGSSWSLLTAVGAGRFSVGSGEPAGLRFPAAPAILEITVGGERRRAVVTDAAGWSWQGVVPAGARLHVGVQRLPGDSSAAEPGHFEITIEGRRGSEPYRIAAAPGAPTRWLDGVFDLSAHAGAMVSLRARAAFDAPPPDAGGVPDELDAGGVPDELAAGGVPHELNAGPNAAQRFAWSDVAITAPGQPLAAARPNVLVILIDTLRADHVRSYGYDRATTPNLDRELAGRGVLIEHAYAQAPWTLPSTLALLTSRIPGEVLPEAIGAFGVPTGVGTMAEWMSRQGYVTAGFFANSGLHAGNGFDRGFDTFYSPPPVTPSMHLHAEEVNRRALPWLQAHQTEPFFLYLHYLDPHDPYDNGEIVDGRSPFYPEYRGGISGQWVHGIYAGRIQLRDVADDLRHLTALYDSEIHYVDARIGELLAAIDPRVLADTLVVLTADHGEELLDHGGWKHGHTLYEEQIRVPLILRWDGHLPPNRRVAGPVRLVDVLPTVAAAVGGAAAPEWQGEDLFAALSGEQPLPRLPVFAQHLNHGPLRAAAIVDGKKLMLFNDRMPFVPADGLQASLWRHDLERLRRSQLFDLERDPRELVDLAAQVESVPAVRARQPLIHRQLDRQLPGLRIIATALPPGMRLEGTIRLDRPPARWFPYFLGKDDRVSRGGAATTFSLSADELEKGFLLEGEFAAIGAIDVHWRDAGRSQPPIRVLLGAGQAYGGGAVPLSLVATSQTPAVPDGPALRIWLRQERGVLATHTEENAETVARLRALGYIQ